VRQFAEPVPAQSFGRARLDRMHAYSWTGACTCRQLASILNLAQNLQTSARAVWRERHNPATISPAKMQAPVDRV